MSISKTNEISMLQISDSFFPTGMYSTSSGLEALFYSGRKITNADDLRELIKVYLECQIGPADCSALGNAYEHAERKELQKLLEVDNTLFSMKLIEEIRSASIRSGTQILKCVISFIPNNDLLNRYHEAIKQRRASGVYPVALAVISHTFGISKYKACLSMLYGFSVSLVGAALRLGTLQHFDGQRIIHELKPSISETLEKNIDRPLTGMWQFAPEIDLFQITHERMSSKMFIT
ncbi:MAG TPA: urease accessory UreF family protein [Candidatus Bathyarchaeia archaeon]|nr:urease accessory UreF family protein [Candidatus Bathyarchaeia archaeon]